MHRLGISVYPEKASNEEIYNYLQLASQYGFTRIFTCLLSVTESADEMMTKFTAFMKQAHELGYEVAVDTNPEVFKKLHASYNNLEPFAKMGIDILRLDGSFGTAQDIEITHNPYHIKIEFNGSVDQGAGLMVEHGANREQMTICHNFYPERYSGLDWDLFNKLNQHWKSYNFTTAAFVSSNAPHTHGPWNVFCGLPTVEIMRGLPIDLQARYYLATGLVDDILIGNAFATEEELKALSEVETDCICIRIDEEESMTDIDRAIVYDYAPHWDRHDHSSYFLRSSMVRLQYKDTSIPPVAYKQDHFKKGDILIVNDNLAHYRGELEIALRDIPNDGERNLCGHVKEEEMMFLDMIEPGHYFKIIK